MSIKGKIGKIEKDVKKNNEGLIRYGVIYKGDPNWRQAEKEVKRKHLAEFGSLDNLRILRTLVPPPLPPPSDEALALVHGTGGTDNDNCDT